MSVEKTTSTSATKTIAAKPIKPLFDEAPLGRLEKPKPKAESKAPKLVPVEELIRPHERQDELVESSRRLNWIEKQELHIARLIRKKFQFEIPQAYDMALISCVVAALSLAIGTKIPVIFVPYVFLLVAMLSLISRVLLGTYEALAHDRWVRYLDKREEENIDYEECPPTAEEQMLIYDNHAWLLPGFDAAVLLAASILLPSIWGFLFGFIAVACVLAAGYLPMYIRTRLQEDYFVRFNISSYYLFILAIILFFGLILPFGLTQIMIYVLLLIALVSSILAAFIYCYQDV